LDLKQAGNSKVWVIVYNAYPFLAVQVAVHVAVHL